jgi:hypothetical protein
MKVRYRIRRLPAAVGLALLALLAATPTVLAFEGREGRDVVIGAEEVVEDDLYVIADEFTLEGTVRGDLFVLAEIVAINGTVEGDLFAAGETVIVDGVLQDDARIVGAALIIGGEIADDLIGVGMSLEHESGASVAGDLLYGGYQALLGGSVSGDVAVGGVAVEIEGSIDGNVMVGVGDTDVDDWGPRTWFGPDLPPRPDMPRVPYVPLGLTLDQDARIGGNLAYYASSRARIPPGVVAGDVEFTRYVAETEYEPHVTVQVPPPEAIFGGWVMRHVRRLTTLLLVGALMVWLAPAWTRRLSAIIERRPLPSLGWGFVAVAAFAVLLLALAIATLTLTILFGVATLGGLAWRSIVLGCIVMATSSFGFGVTWAYVTRIAISLLLGRLIFRLFKSEAADHRWWPMLVGVPVYVLITAVPILGWFAGAATVLLGLGAVWLWGRDLFVSRQAAPVTEE